MIILWTDGSAEPNPGPGGWAVIKQIDKEGKEGEPVALGSAPKTTNIRMEGEALKAAMNYMSEEECEIHTDSQFWINVLEKWAPEWKANDWHKKTDARYDRNGNFLEWKETSIKNIELVQELYELYFTGNIKLVWVRGHVGTALNEMADEWANKARLGEKI